jgi:amidase
MTETPWSDPVGAFVPHGRVTRPSSADGPLAGLTIAVKDLFDWRGVPTGAGNPDWLASHPVPETDAAALRLVVEAGAGLRGKTVTDELAYSIHGDNVHYGTPANAAAPGRVPGGSSSGSAAAVAAGLVDAALGTDTGGSVRVPAAYCGLFGLRTTHGAVDRTGLVPLSESFDTVGWFSRSPAPLAALAEVLLPIQTAARHWDKAWVLAEADELTDAGTQLALRTVRDRLGLPLFELRGLVEPWGGLEGLRQAYATVQGFEAWEAHGPWIESRSPAFGPAIAQRFEAASRITPPQVAKARKVLTGFRTALRRAVGDRNVLVLPATAGPAPLVGEDPQAVDQVRTRTMRLTCLAGLAGLPQVTVPQKGSDGLPRGVGLLGPADSDRALCLLAAPAAGGL